MENENTQVQPDASSKKARRGGAEPQLSDWGRALISVRDMIDERAQLFTRVEELDRKIVEAIIERVHPGSYPAVP